MAELSGGQLITIDGERLCGSYNREDRQSAIHMVNAFASENNVVLEQIKTQSKSNEITAIPALLNLLALKENQKALHDAVRSALAESLHEEMVCMEKSHGRSEARAYHVMEAASLANTFPEWKGLKSVGVTLS